MLQPWICPILQEGLIFVSVELFFYVGRFTPSRIKSGFVYPK
jgi:hypothetical protein